MSSAFRWNSGDRDERHVEVPDLVQGTKESRWVDHCLLEKNISIFKVGDCPSLEPCKPVLVKVISDPDFISKSSSI